MYNAINAINKTISDFENATQVINKTFKNRKYESILDEDTELDGIFKEILDTCHPHEFLSALEAIYFQSNSDPTLVENVYVARTEITLLYTIRDILVNVKLATNRMKSCEEQEKRILEKIRKFLNELWALVDDILNNIAIFYEEVLEKKASYDTIDNLRKEKVTIQKIFEQIRFVEDNSSAKLKSDDLKFIKNLTLFAAENGIFEATEMQIRQLAVQKKLPSYYSQKIKFTKKRCGADAYRLAKVFKLNFEQANTAFDLGEVKLSNNNNPKDSLSTSLDKFFRSQYEMYYKDDSNCLFSFKYLLSEIS